MSLAITMFAWEADALTGVANYHDVPVCCRAGGATIAELFGFTHATKLQRGVEKANAFELMKDAFERKIERGEFDSDPLRSVTLLVDDLRR